MIWLQDADFTLYNGDALDVLRELPDESVDCVITSPPYWGLRDYGVPGQLGLEPTPEEYVTRMVEVFREVRRVMAKHGTCWVNMGDSYMGGGGGNYGSGVSNTHGQHLTNVRNRPDFIAKTGCKAKDLVGIPWMLAFALRADGWYLRSDIVWSKPNPMPESVTDRPTKAHEYVFLLSKQPRYFFDQEAVREKYDDPARMATRREVSGPATYHYDPASGGRTAGAAVGPDGRRKTVVRGADGSIQHRDGERWPNSGRNIRSVWEIATQPFPEAHFATFPEELVRRCLLAGCPENGVCLDPFMGSGTTALVARKHGRRCVGIELSAEYCELIQRRTQQLSLLAVES